MLIRKIKPGPGSNQKIKRSFLFCIDSCDSESRLIFQHFSRSSTRLAFLCTSGVEVKKKTENHPVDPTQKSQTGHNKNTPLQSAARRRAMLRRKTSPAQWRSTGRSMLRQNRTELEYVAETTRIRFSKAHPGEAQCHAAKTSPA